MCNIVNDFRFLCIHQLHTYWLLLTANKKLQINILLSMKTFSCHIFMFCMSFWCLLHSLKVTFLFLLLLHVFSSGNLLKQSGEECLWCAFSGKVCLCILQRQIVSSFRVLRLGRCLRFVDHLFWVKSVYWECFLTILLDRNMTISYIKCHCPNQTQMSIHKYPFANCILWYKYCITFDKMHCFF